uniref:KIAA0040 n=1 Tax=Sinocyclocheilus anshuiensis TaxID=1608454 RepID=A0A671PZP3_9TELE
KEKHLISNFFNDIWNLASAKHDQSVYNTVCLVVLLTLPLVVLFTSLLVCCHCCCCRETSVTNAKTKKKNASQNNEDLWISVKADPMSSERHALTMV